MTPTETRFPWTLSSAFFFPFDLCASCDEIQGDQWAEVKGVILEDKSAPHRDREEWEVPCQGKQCTE